MPRYEIVAHITRQVECQTAEEAAAIIREQILARADGTANVVHLAVWREDAPPAVSPLPAGPRQTLDAFFAALERCAVEAEDAFRGRVEAILTAQSAPERRGSGER